MFDKKSIRDLISADERPSNLYIIIGNDLFLVQETLTRLRVEARKQGYNHRITISLDQNNRHEKVFESMQSSSLFDERFILEVNIPNAKPNKYSLEKLIWIIKRIGLDHDANVVIFVTIPKIDKIIRKTLWMKELSRNGIVLNISKIQRKSLPNWIEKRLFMQGQTADSNLIEWIANKVEGDLVAAQNEILKLNLLCPKGRLENLEARKIVQDVAHYDTFELSQAILLGNTSRALHILDRLRENGESLSRIIWIIGEKILSSAILSQETICNNNVKNRKSNNLFDKLDSVAWFQTIRHIHEIELSIKGFQISDRLSDPWEELARLSLFFSKQILNANSS